MGIGLICVYPCLIPWPSFLPFTPAPTTQGSLLIPATGSHSETGRLTITASANKSVSSFSIRCRHSCQPTAASPW